MKLHIVTVGAPKLEYAKSGWGEYLSRLKRLHEVRVTHIADKNNTAEHLLASAKGTTLVVMEIKGQSVTSQQLGEFLLKRELAARELTFMIGGPEGLAEQVIDSADFALSLSRLTLPHDLAMVVLLEALYRASMINSGLPYHK